jgi:hypothetical protein
MAEIVAADIPYERQTDPTSNRMCGAAALCMVYRSFGITASQVELAPKLTGPKASGNSAARTYLMAQDALARGLGAVVFRAKDPLGTLKACQDRPVRLVLNHRMNLESPRGHFSVLVRVADEHVVVHDPQIGPSTRILATDLLKLWRPLGGASEITGNVLAAFGKDRQAADPCPKCETVVPETITCPGCRKPILLQPAAVLGCMNATCPERTWAALFCPYCDSTVVDASGKTAEAPGETPAAPSTGATPSTGKPGEIDDDPLKIKSLSQEIDKFVAVIMAGTNCQPSPYLQSLLTTIGKYQGQMLELQKKEAAQIRAKAAEPPKAPAPARQPAAVPPPPPAQPPERPPVDWNELGRQLLVELGLQEGAAATRPPKRRDADEPQLTPNTREIQEMLKKRGLMK